MTQPPYGSPPPPVPPYGSPPVFGSPAAVAAWGPRGGRSIARIERIGDTRFGLAYLDVPPVVSGLSVGSLVGGIASTVVTLLVACFGFIGAAEGWGGWVAGAFAVLAVVLGAAGVGLAVAARRQIRRPAQAGATRYTGGGLATGGLSCGLAGIGLTAVLLVGVLLVQTT